MGNHKLIEFIHVHRTGQIWLNMSFKSLWRQVMMRRSKYLNLEQATCLKMQGG